MAQEFNKLISGNKGVGTPFALYPDYINSMFSACMSDFSGTSAPDKPEIGMTYYNTVEKKQYRYLGQTEGWAEAIAGDKTVSDLKTEIETARIGEASLEDRIIKLASQNSGNAFPTGQNVWVGIPCYRKDLQAIYVCTFVDPSGANHTWTDISDLMPGLGQLKIEVLNARGVAASLGARLDVSLNHDGSLKGNAPAGEWWEPSTPYTFTKVNTDKLEIADGDYTALFETDRAVLLHPSHNKAYVVSSSYENETNKTIVVIDEEVGGDTEIQFGAPVGNASKVKEASKEAAGVVEITDSVRASSEISPEENKVPTEKAVALALEAQEVPLVQTINPSQSASTEKAPSEKAIALALEELKKTTSETGDFKISYKNAIEGYLLCDGSAVSRETYVALFSVIGTMFGEGDGSTTFNLPDFRGRFIQGANNDLGSVKEAGLPNITGGGLQFGSVINNPNMYGALFNNSYNNVRGAGYNDACGVAFDASRSNSIYGASDTVQPPAISLNVFIKY